MTAAGYTRYELRRIVRNRRFFIFSLGFPLLLYFLIATPNRHEADLGGSGISAPLYFMVGLAAFGTMNAVMGTGARIAAERVIGWNRQLRITPLSTRVYFRAKILSAYITAGTTIALLYVSGTALGVRLSVPTWLEMTGLLLVGLVPFVALGLLLGHLVNADAVGPAIGGLTALFGFFGGVWFPVSGSGLLHDVAVALPSYWLVQASRVGIGGGGWGATAWLVVALWTAALVVLARWAYRRDTERA
jgi:ABC-2 type transport system permease protein